MVIIVENDREKRVQLHHLFESYVPLGQLLTVKDTTELLRALTRVKATSIWISSSDQHHLVELRMVADCADAAIYVMAASSLELNPFLLKRCGAKGVFVPLRPYQIEQLTRSAFNNSSFQFDYMANDKRMDDDHQKYIPGVQEKTTLGGTHNTGVTSADPAEKELIEKQGNFAKIKPKEKDEEER